MELLFLTVELSYNIVNIKRDHVYKYYNAGNLSAKSMTAKYKSKFKLSESLDGGHHCNTTIKLSYILLKLKSNMNIIEGRK